MYRFGRLKLPTGAGLVVFLAVAAVLAIFVARIAGAILRVAAQVVWYAIVFAVVVALLSWAWNRFTANRNRSVQQVPQAPQWEDRDEYGRRRY